MATVNEIRKTRLKKLEKIENSGFLAYPISTKRTHTAAGVLKSFSSLARSKKEVVVAGRIRLLRVHGGSTFIQVQDGTGYVQAYLKKDRLGEKAYKFFLDNFDLGDFIAVRGVMFKTKKGEKTVEAADYSMLAKSLLPLPEKWHGLQDAEERFRKRYLDLVFNDDVRKKFETRSLIIKSLREFLEKEGFLGVETPVLQPIYGGARAKPFKTHLNAMDIDLFLRISPELYLKRLLVGGFEKVYEIGKCFRNEGVDRAHNPDFTILEFYWAYADYKELMKLVEKMFEHVVRKVFKKSAFAYEGKKLDFKPPLKRVEFYDLFRKMTGIDLEEVNESALAKEARKMGIDVKKGTPKAEIADEMFKTFRHKLIEPVFVIHYPKGMQTLSKGLDSDSGKLANFQLIAAGFELCNAFSELNDPVEQRSRFEEQEKLFRKGFEEAQRTDKDYLEAMEYGMPPAAGFGGGVDRLVALLTNSHSLREVILFPTMKPKK